MPYKRTVVFHSVEQLAGGVLGGGGCVSETKVAQP